MFTKFTIDCNNARILCNHLYNLDYSENNTQPLPEIKLFSKKSEYKINSINANDSTFQIMHDNKPYSFFKDVYYVKNNNNCHINASVEYNCDKLNNYYTRKLLKKCKFTIAEDYATIFCNFLKNLLSNINVNVKQAIQLHDYTIILIKPDNDTVRIAEFNPMDLSFKVHYDPTTYYFNKHICYQKPKK